MRGAITLLTVAAFVAVGSAAVVAQKGRGPKATPSVHGPKVSGGQTTTTRGPKSTQTRGPRTTTAAGGAQSTTHGNKPAKATTTTTTTTNTTTSPNLPRNQRLVDRLRTLLDLPPGTDMSPYAADFKNQGQFVAAVHVSENLGINFSELKSLMIDKNLSLGQAIHEIKPGIDANTEARRAVNQSRQQ